MRAICTLLIVAVLVVAALQGFRHLRTEVLNVQQQDYQQHLVMTGAGDAG